MVKEKFKQLGRLKKGIGPSLFCNLVGLNPIGEEQGDEEAMDRSDVWMERLNDYIATCIVSSGERNEGILRSGMPIRTKA